MGGTGHLPQEVSASGGVGGTGAPAAADGTRDVSGLTIGPGDAIGMRLDVEVATPVSERPDGGIAAMGQPIDLLPNARVPDGLTPGTSVQMSPAPLRAIRFSPHPQWAAH